MIRRISLIQTCWMYINGLMDAERYAQGPQGETGERGPGGIGLLR